MRPDPRKAFGYSGEGLAAGYLFARGYRLLARNWRAGRGELDLVCEHRGVIVFVEVKARRTPAFGTPHEAVDRAKQGRVMAIARAYMARHPGRRCRFDVVAIDLGGPKPRITHLPDAFP
jgi:putative endonuclease